MIMANGNIWQLYVTRQDEHGNGNHDHQMMITNDNGRPWVTARNNNIR